MNVLIACESSGCVRDAFLSLGHHAVSVDLDPTERPGPHLQADIRSVNFSGVDLVIAHPTCTYLSNAGVRHFHIRRTNPDVLYCEDRWAALDPACEFFRFFLSLPVPRVAIENPIPHKYAVDRIGRKYDQIIRPWQFGHKELKATCLWLKGLPPLMDTCNVGPPPVVTKEPERYWEWAKVHRESPGKNRARNRSRTLPGIAMAMAEQWG
jgi:hypothetical protein